MSEPMDDRAPILRPAPRPQTQGVFSDEEVQALIQSRCAHRKDSDKTCEQELWISVYFDGTGNNVDVDAQNKAHSNVARLWQITKGNPENSNGVKIIRQKDEGIFAIYIPGLGTKFDAIGDSGSAVGRGFARHGEARLKRALEEVEKVINAAAAKASVNPNLRIRMIGVSIFGFSRGAALARAFAIRLAQASEAKGSGYVWKKGEFPFRLHFMGLFDTVASVGTPYSLRSKSFWPHLLAMVGGGWTAVGAPLWPLFELITFTMTQADGHQAWASDQKIPAMVERCIHLVAAHECRLSFPVDSVARNGSIPGNCEEYIYPGVHSDVGGGYGKGEQGRSREPEDMLSRIALHHMYREAWKAGVPLKHPREWQENEKTDFETSDKLIQAFNAYLDMPEIAGGARALPTWVKAHMGLYFRWRKTTIEQAVLADSYEPKDSKGNPETPKARRTRRKSYEEGVRQANENFAKDARKLIERANRGKADLTQYERLLKDSWEEAVPPPAVCDFFQNYVHDSVAGFRDAVFYQKMLKWIGFTQNESMELDDSRLGIPRVFYQGGDRKADIATITNAENQPMYA